MFEKPLGHWDMGPILLSDLKSLHHDVMWLVYDGCDVAMTPTPSNSIFYQSLYSPFPQLASVWEFADAHDTQQWRMLHLLRVWARPGSRVDGSQRMTMADMRFISMSFTTGVQNVLRVLWMSEKGLCGLLPISNRNEWRVFVRTEAILLHVFRDPGNRLTAVDWRWLKQPLMHAA